VLRSSYEIEDEATVHSSHCVRERERERELKSLIEWPVAELVVLLQSDDGALCLVGVEGGRVHSLIWGHNI
jgi:hypothetical protein